jgi:hypothetical protein
MAQIASVDPLTTDAEFLCITHDPIGLTQIPTVTADSVEITNGVVGSGSDYETKRVTDTQTIIRRKDFATAVTFQVTSAVFDTVPFIDGLPQGLPPIGQAIIGQNFIIQ